jgi:Leucine-rich repeat (LRR) protein
MKCKKIKKIECVNNEIETLEELENCSYLCELICSSNKINTLEHFPNCFNLTRINISYCNINSLKGLENCSMLSSIIASNTPITEDECLRLKTQIKRSAKDKHLYILLTKK